MSHSVSPSRRPSFKPRSCLSSAKSLCLLTILISFLFHFVLWPSFNGSQDLSFKSRLSTISGLSSIFPLLSNQSTNSSENHRPHSMQELEDECSQNQLAISSAGKPCINLTSTLQKQSIYLPSYNPTPYFYCSIPKNGCTYHLALLERMGGAEMYESAVTIHNKETKYNHSIVRLSSEAIATYLKNENFPKYLVIRNPIARILSAYLDKVQPWLSVENRTVQHFETWIYQEFDPELPQDRDWSKTNPHWRPQVEFCGFKIRDVWSYFNVFRVEKPEEYVDFLYDIVPKKFLVDGWGKPSNFSFRDHVLGPRKRTGHTNEKVLKYFRSIAVFDHLAKKLEEDISTLGYNSEVAQLREDILEANAKKDDETDENDA